MDGGFNDIKIDDILMDGLGRRWIVRSFVGNECVLASLEGGRHPRYVTSEIMKENFIKIENEAAD
jgi:hypothetical protein